MTRYLLDTNAMSYIVNGKFPAFRERFETISLETVAVSVITEAELRFGLARRPGARELSDSVHAVLAKIEILPWTSTAAIAYADMRLMLERQGMPMGAMDMMIAAHALAEDLVLVTSDAAFRRIERLRVEDWTLP